MSMFAKNLSHGVYGGLKAYLQGACSFKDIIFYNAHYSFGHDELASKQST